MKAGEARRNPHPAILLVGDSGSHKSFFCGSCPDPVVLDFDGGAAAILAQTAPETEIFTFKDAPHGQKPRTADVGIFQYGKAWPSFIDKINILGSQMDKGTLPFKTICIDSLTTLAASAMSYVLLSDGIPGDNPKIQHWGSQIQLIERFIDQFASWPCIKVVTAHIQRNTNDLTQEIEQLPLVTGKLAGKIGIYFDEVWFTTPKKDKDGKRSWTLTTESGGMVRQAKTRFGVPDGTITSWQAVEPYLNGTKVNPIYGGK